MDFVTLTMPCPVCTQGSAPGTVRNRDGKPVLCPNCGGEATVPIRARRQPFDYSFPYLDESAAPPDAESSGTIELQLDDDAFFEFETIVAYGSGAGGIVPVGNGIAVQMSDLSSGWQFSNRLLAILTDPYEGGNFFGIAPMPAALLVPYIFRPSSVVQLAWQCGSGDSGNQFALQVVLKGYKLYPLDDASAAALGTGKAAA